MASYGSHAMAYTDIIGVWKFKKGGEGRSGLELDLIERSREILSKKLCTLIIIHLDRQENQWNDDRKENSTDSDPNTDPSLYNDS